MKKNLFILLALLMTINSQAQEPALYHITYDCEAKSATGVAKLYRWSLDIGKTTAVFYNDNERGFNQDLAKLHVKGDPIKALEQMDALDKKYPTKNSLQVLLGSPQKDKYTYYNNILNSKLKYEEPMPKIAWQLSDSTKTINGYECRQAQGSLYGRTWTVWYATELPLNYGPYLLRGLPGLILDAADTEGCFHFTLAGIEKAADNKTVSLFMDKDAQKCTRKRYLKMRTETNGLSQQQIVDRILSQNAVDTEAGSTVIMDKKDNDISDQKLPKKNFLDKE